MCSFPPATKCLFLLILLTFSSFSLALDTQFISNNAQSNGAIYLKSDIALQSQSTAESIFTLQQINGDSSVTQKAQVFIDARNLVSTEELALQYLVKPSPEKLNKFLITMEKRLNFDGGIGAYNGFGSDLLSTSYYLQVLKRSGLVNDQSNKASTYLISQQNSDGSWSIFNGPNKTEITAIAANALWLFRNNYAVKTTIDKAITYLETTKQGDLWGSLQSSVLALNILLKAKTDRQPYQKSMNALSALQKQNGSFENDVYLTALALKILDNNNKPAEDEIILSGKIIDGLNGQALSGAVIKLQGVTSYTINSNQEGIFILNNINPGSYTVTISNSGFNTIKYKALFPTGSKNNVGNIQLIRTSSTPNGEPVKTATIRGIVTDKRTAKPIVNAQIILKANTSITTQSNAAGAYQLNVVPAGNIQIQVSATGYDTIEGSSTITAGQTLLFSPALQEKVDVGVSVQGVVVDSATQKPLSSVSISIKDGKGFINNTITANDGSYNIAGLNQGNMEFSAKLNGYYEAAAKTTTKDGNRFEFSPQLTPLTKDKVITKGRLKGYVTDAVTGKALNNVSVLLTYTSGKTRTVKTNLQGSFLLEELDPGETLIKLSLDEYKVFSAGLTIQEGLLSDAGQIKLVPTNATPAKVSVNTKDARTKQPLAGVKFVLKNKNDNSEQLFYSNNNGMVQISTDKFSAYELIASYEGYISQNYTMNLAAGNEINLGNIFLRPVKAVDLLADLSLEKINYSQVNTDLQSLKVTGFVDVDITNKGNIKVDKAFNVAAFYDVNANKKYDLSIDQLLGTQQVSKTMDVDESIKLKIAVNGNAPFRDAPIYVFVDSSEVIIESNKDNNYSSLKVICASSNTCPVKRSTSKDIKPVVKWHWDGSSSTNFPQYKQVVMAPIVVQLNDDNNDGKINNSDTPDIVFISNQYQAANGVMRAVDGKTGKELWAYGDKKFFWASNIAAADINKDGKIEIIALTEDSKMLSLSSEGKLLWQTSFKLLNSGTMGAPSIVDLNQDGYPEIVYANMAISRKGQLLWRGKGNYTGVNDRFKNQEISFISAADIHPEPGVELVVGASLYSATGRLLWQNSSVGDGYTAIGNFDKNPDAEIAIVTKGKLFILDYLGKILHGPVQIPGGVDGGPPTVADIDGDGIPEIGIAGATGYGVYRANLELLWQRPTSDVSSAITGSSVFDFDGDGSAEIVYADEYFLRIYRGETGEVIYKVDNTSTTGSELPVIADVDNDGQAEIVVVSNTLRSQGTFGVRVFEDSNNQWVATRNIWNQHAYHIDNINDDLTVPVVQQKSWLTHNTFRLNTFPSCGLIKDNNKVLFTYKDAFDVSALQFNGKAAVINNNSEKAALRITPALKNQSGSIFTKNTIPLTDKKGFNASFSTRFSFAMSDSEGTLNDKDGKGADGIVFTIQTNSNSVGSQGLGIGYQNISNSVGIEFDTFDNSPANGFQVNDVSGNHIGININGNINSIAQVNIDKRMNDGDTWYAWVDYNGNTDILEVRLSTDSIRPAAATLKTQVDLVQVLGVKDAYLGFTSGTGSDWSNHDILSWEFINKYQPIDAVNDLSISQLVLQDTNGISVSARIGNAGDALISAGMPVKVFAGDPSLGKVLSQFALPEMAANTYKDITISTIKGVSAGDKIYVMVDPDNSLKECKEDNNTMSVDAAGVSGNITLTLDAKAYQPSSTLTAATVIKNTGVLPSDFTAKLFIDDQADNEIALVKQYAANKLTPNGNKQHSDPWSLQGLVTGTYKARAQLYDQYNNLIATDTKSFTITQLFKADGSSNGKPLANVRASTDRPRYHINDQVNLAALVENTTTMHAIAKPQLQLTVTNAQGQSVFNKETKLASLAPQQLAEQNHDLILANAAIGTYQYKAILKDVTGKIYGTAISTFEVVNNINAAVSGNVIAQFKTLKQGEQQSCTLVTSNTGNTALSNVPITYRLENLDKQQTINSQTFNVNLAVQGKNNQLQSFPTRALEVGNYACVLEAILKGKATALAYAQFELQEAPIKFASSFKVSDAPRLLVLTDPVVNSCKAYKSITLNSQFDANHNVNDGIYSKVYANSSKPADIEYAKPIDFTTAESIVDKKSGQPNLIVKSIDGDKNVTITIKSDKAFKGDYQLKQFIFAHGYSPLKQSTVFSLSCGNSELSVGQQLGDFKVLSFETVDVDKLAYEKNDYKPVEMPLVAEQHAKLYSLLKNTSYKRVESSDEFFKQLLTGNYNQYMVLSTVNKITKIQSKWLRESVNSGAGFIYANGRVPYEDALWRILGITNSTNNTSNYHYHYTHSDRDVRSKGFEAVTNRLGISNNYDFVLDRHYPCLRLTNAELVAKLLPLPGTVVSDPNKLFPAVAYTAYGKGKTVYMSFDLLAELTAATTTQPYLEALFNNSLLKTSPKAYSRIKAVQLSVENQGYPTPTNVEILWQAQSQLIDSLPTSEFAANKHTWKFDFERNQQSNFTSWAAPFYTQGNANVTANFYIGSDSTGTPYQSHSLKLSSQAPLKNLRTIRDELKATINHLPYYQHQKIWDAAARLGKAIYYNDHNDPTNVAVYLLMATDYLQSIDHATVQELRQLIDRHIYQASLKVNL